MIGPFRLTAILFVTCVVVAESLSVAGHAGHGAYGSCPTYWNAFGYSCYRFFGQSVTLPEARYNCRSHGSGSKIAYLASIHSQGENDYIAALFKSYTDHSEDNNQHVWIGLNDEAEEGKFVWTDGTPTDFIHWAHSEPSGLVNSVGVIMIHPKHRDYGLWHDVDVTARSRYICKMPRF